MYNIKILEKHMKQTRVILVLIGILSCTVLVNKDKENYIVQNTPIVKIAEETKYTKLTKYISRNYDIPKNKAYKIVIKADAHSSKTFPQLEDILAIIAVESRFKTEARSPTNAVGLMQIVYKKSSTNVEQNIKDGSTLLKKYYHLTKSKDATIQSYNIGIGSYYNGLRSKEYLEKVKKHKRKFNEICTTKSIHPSRYSNKSKR